MTNPESQGLNNFQAMNFEGAERARQRFGLRQPSAAFETRTVDRKAPEGRRTPKPGGVGGGLWIIPTLLLFFLATVLPAAESQGTPIDATRHLVDRLFPSQSNQFIIETIPSDDGRDVFE